MYKDKYCICKRGNEIYLTCNTLPNLREHFDRCEDIGERFFEELDLLDLTLCRDYDKIQIWNRN